MEPKNSPPREPPMRPSDEGDPDGLRRARAQGDAFLQTVDYMATQIAEHGGKQRAGEYLVAYAVEKAEGMYHPGADGQLEWREPQNENIHVEVVVCDGADHRFVPGLIVQVTLIEEVTGREVGTHEQPFLWHPYLYHYGRNWHVPGDGTYTLRVYIEPPTFPRHDKVNGRRFAEPVEVTFTGIALRTGKD